MRTDAGERRLSMLRWGLFPAWARDPAIGHKLINARAETAAVKPAFRAAFSKRRCVVPVDGFYEWRREGSVHQPWLIARRDGGPMVLAGLWEGWRVPEGMETFTILTTEASATMRVLHHRMPVILPEDTFGPWLTGEDVRLGPAP